MENFKFQVSVEKPDGGFTFFHTIEVTPTGILYCSNLINRLTGVYKSLFSCDLDPDGPFGIPVDDALFVLFVAKIKKAMSVEDLLDLFDNGKSILEREKVSGSDYVQYSFKVLEHNVEN